VSYADGDCETLDWAELKTILINNTGSSDDTSRSGSDFPIPHPVILKEGDVCEPSEYSPGEI
jgi:hypothetical protein